MRYLALALWFLTVVPAGAVEPSEMLSDPVLEARARALDEVLRCVKCRSENIASSGADWAADARVLVRELITEGKSDPEVLEFFVARYGEYVLMRPRASGAGLLVWLSAPALLLAGLGVAVVFLRKRAVPNAPSDLSDRERDRLDELMRD